MKLLITFLLAISVLAVPVAAQAQAMGNGRGITKKEEPEQTANDRLRKGTEEKAYKDSLSKVPQKEYDPWSGIRETEPPNKTPAVKKKP